MPPSDARQQPAVQRFEAVVHGRVQGVGFRYATQTMGNSLHLHGQVRNRSDGTVIVVAQGPSAALQSLLAWLHEGPRMAHVSHVQVTWQTPYDDLPSFEVQF